MAGRFEKLVADLRRCAAFARDLHKGQAADGKRADGRTITGADLQAAVDYSAATFGKAACYVEAREHIGINHPQLLDDFDKLREAIEKAHESEGPEDIASALDDMARYIEQLDDSSRRHEESNAVIVEKLDIVIENQNTHQAGHNDLINTTKSGFKSIENQVKLARSDHAELRSDHAELKRTGAEVKAGVATIAATMPNAEQLQEILKAINANKSLDKRVTNSQASRILQITFSHDNRFKRVTERTISNWIRAGIVPKANGYPISKADFASLSTFLHWASQLAAHESIVPQFTQPNLKQINTLFSEK